MCGWYKMGASSLQILYKAIYIKNFLCLTLGSGLLDFSDHSASGFGEFAKQVCRGANDIHTLFDVGHAFGFELEFVDLVEQEFACGARQLDDRHNLLCHDFMGVGGFWRPTYRTFRFFHVSSPPLGSWCLYLRVSLQLRNRP